MTLTKTLYRTPLILFLIFFSFFAMSPTLSYAQEPGEAKATITPQQEQTPQEAQQEQLENIGGMSRFGAPNVVTMLAVITLLALLPFAILLLTSYTKIVIVLSLVRNALGVQQAPPNQVLNGVALLMTIYVMFPTGVAMYNAGKNYIENEAPSTLFSANTASYLVNVIEKSKDPLRDFLIRNMSTSHQKNFFQLAYRSLPEDYRKELTPKDFIVLIPAYITSQIKGAFEIGVLIYLPFFVIDLVTSNILLAMGMMMLSPLTIALPLKLLLIVMTDGWTLIIQGLVLTYK